MVYTAFRMATIEDFISEWRADTPYVVAHSSGSTGVPKEIHLLKEDMRVSARATNEFFGINSQSTLACPLSIDYIAGKMMYVRAFEARCKIVQLPVSNIFDIDSNFDLVAIVPSQIKSLLIDDKIANKIKNVIIGGAPLNDEQIQALRRVGVNAYATYGMTETCSHVALSSIYDDNQIFKAMPGINFSIDNSNCLIINARKYSFKTLKTNDIVELISPTSFKWIGRFDNVINSGGIKIHPELLEKEISKWIKSPFYIIGISDKKWGEAPVIVFEGEKDNEKAIIELLRTKVDHRICPTRAFAVRQLPRTANGKIKRNKIQSEA